MGHAVVQFSLLVLQLVRQHFDLGLQFLGMFLHGEDHATVLLEQVDLFLALHIGLRHIRNLLLQGLIVLHNVGILVLQVIAFRGMQLTLLFQLCLESNHFILHAIHLGQHFLAT